MLDLCRWYQCKVYTLNGWLNDYNDSNDGRSTMFADARPALRERLEGREERRVVSRAEWRKLLAWGYAVERYDGSTWALANGGALGTILEPVVVV